MQRRVERPLVDAQHVARYLLDPLRDCPSVHGREGEGAKDQQVECALQQVETRGRHACAPVCLTGPSCRMSTACARVLSNVNTSAPSYASKSWGRTVGRE